MNMRGGVVLYGQILTAGSIASQAERPMMPTYFPGTAPV